MTAGGAAEILGAWRYFATYGSILFFFPAVHYSNEYNGAGVRELFGCESGVSATAPGINTRSPCRSPRSSKSCRKNADYIEYAGNRLIICIFGAAACFTYI